MTTDSVPAELKLDKILDSTSKQNLLPGCKRRVNQDYFLLRILIFH